MEQKNENNNLEKIQNQISGLKASARFITFVLLILTLVEIAQLYMSYVRFDTWYN